MYLGSIKKWDDMFNSIINSARAIPRLYGVTSYLNHPRRQKRQMPSRVCAQLQYQLPSLIPHHLHDIHNQALRRHHMLIKGANRLSNKRKKRRRSEEEASTKKEEKGQNTQPSGRPACPRRRIPSNHHHSRHHLIIITPISQTLPPLLRH
jgi:hypothetical protein